MLAEDDDDSIPDPTSTPSPTRSPPKRKWSPRRRSVTGTLFRSVKTHLSVVRAAISHGHVKHSTINSEDNVSLQDSVVEYKGGELFEWDATTESPGERASDTPKRKTPTNSSNSNLLSMAGGSSSTMKVAPSRGPQQQQAPQPLREQPSQLPLLELEQPILGTTTDAVMMYEMTASMPADLSPQFQKQRKLNMLDQQSSSLPDSFSHEGNQPSSPGNSCNSRQLQQQRQLSSQQIAAPTVPAVPMATSWSWSEQFFFSQDDEDVSVEDDSEDNGDGGWAKAAVASSPPSIEQDPSFPSIRPVNSVKFETIVEQPDGDDDHTCNDTIIEKARQRGKKASRASSVGAFVTFLKALFGIGMLSNPAVLGEVGLVLGTFCHLFIVVGCAFSCYLLLSARQMAKVEVMAKQRRDRERREEYEMWRLETINRAAQRAGWRTRMPQNGSAAHSDPTLPTVNTSNSVVGMDQSQRAVLSAGAGTDVCDSQQMLHATNTGSIEEWTVAPVPVKLPVTLNSVGTSIIPPKEGWGRCEQAVKNATGRDVESCAITPSVGKSEEGNPLATPSCGNVQLVKQPLRRGSVLSPPGISRRSGSPRRLNTSSNKASTLVSDDYQRFTDKIHSDYMAQPALLEPPMPPPSKPPQIRLVTYGDVAKYLAGRRASFFIMITICTVHLMFASGMVHLAVENLCYVIGWERLGWSYVEEYVEQNDRRVTMMRMLRRLGPSEDEDGDEMQDEHDWSGEERGQEHQSPSRSSDEEEYYLEWKGPDFIGRLAMASLLFPIIQGLLQIPTLTELATISSVGLFSYAFGCIGSMLYTAVVLTDGHPFLDHPDDMWKTKWSGIPTYVATTIYCIEGINLALPTVSSIEGAQRWGPTLMRQQSSQLVGGGRVGTGERERQDLSVFIVVGAVFLYGMVTLVVSWIGLAGGLGGGIGTIHGEDGCWDVTYCLNSSAVRFTYMLSLGVALVLTLPVILYPSTEMLEVWLDERNDERRRKIEAAASAVASPQGEQLPDRPLWLKQKSLLPDDETVCTVSDMSPRSLGIRHDDIEMREMSSFGVGPGEYVAPNINPLSRSPEPSPMTFQNDNESTVMAGIDTAVNSPITAGQQRSENTKLKARRKLKYWKLRMFLAFIICVIGTIEGSFPTALKAAEVIRGVGLSIAGLIFPPLLYMSAVGGNFTVPMAAAMALLIGLGLFNIVLVLMSAFGSRDFIVEEGRGNFYESLS